MAKIMAEKLRRRASPAAVARSLRELATLWKPPPDGNETAPVLATPTRQVEQENGHANHSTLTRAKHKAAA